MPTWYFIFLVILELIRFLWDCFIS